MRLLDGQVSLSASDLANHLGCSHLTTLDLRAAHGDLTPPIWRDPALDALQQRGFEHELAYLNHLRQLGKSITEAKTDPNQSGAEATIEAMRAGPDVIAQPTLTTSRWFGRADILLRVPTPSALGPYSYEVIDTKLARETRAGTILQLCLYSDAVAEIQDHVPEFMHVVAPDTDFQPETFRLSDYLAYHRLVKVRLAAVVDAAPGDAPPTYPEPVPQCDICRWWSACDKRRHDDDHLSLVAGISKLQRREVSTWGVSTLAQLARVPVPLSRRPKRGTPDGYVRAREQARVQLQGREQQRPVHELLDREPDRGLARLPAPSPGDVFFDIEGDAFVGTTGLEYLFGWVVSSDDHAPEYHQRWALDGAQERDMFEAFVDEIMDRWQRFPDLHVYHYAPYEPGAIKRLMGRYATREDEVDRMLRARVFVDLYSITKQALRASVERYSIKDLEQFYGYQRQIELHEASMNLRAFERSLELGKVDVVPQAVRVAVQAYNRDDCVSTLRLRDWLEGLRAGLVQGGEDVPRPVPRDAEPSEALSERQQRVLALMERLLRDVPDEREDRSDEQHARWLLAHMLDWHRREAKVARWEYFRLAELGEDELMDERAGLVGLEFEEHVGGTPKCPIHRYRFPPQDTGVKKGDDLHTGADAPLGKVERIDLGVRTIDIKKRAVAADLHPRSAFANSSVRTDVLADSLFRLGEWVAEHGANADGPRRAGRDLLLGLLPRCSKPTQPGAALQRADETALKAARRLALELDGGVLAIQGPPGAGKTFTGARMICELVRAGKKVGITAGGHKVVRNLLDEVVKAGAELGVPVRCLQKVSRTPAKDEGQPIQETKDNPPVHAALASGTVDVVGGTAWLWSREAATESLDVLFVDEAGQMSLANVLAVSQAARSVVLLGDPQQLEQPLQGTHPEGTDVSALEHLLCGKQTIAADRGLFLAETYRLHPTICQLTSELFYEGRLTSRPQLAQQALLGDTPFAGAGLWSVPAEHDGNRNSSTEEAEIVADLYNALLSGHVSWRNQHGVEAKLTAADILIVAPYNAHVGLLGERLPSAKIGTVDKFQGQEAPVVIYSVATSSPDEAPRGMEFLFSLNRLNVATSRARCACILVANPRLFEPDCRTPRQMQLANAFCRYAELATTVGAGVPNPVEDGAGRKPS